MRSRNPKAAAGFVPHKKREAAVSAAKRIKAERHEMMEMDGATDSPDHGHYLVEARRSSRHSQGGDQGAGAFVLVPSEKSKQKGGVMRLPCEGAL